MLGNAAMIIAGTVVGSAGTLLTQLMAKAMNRSIGNVLFIPLVPAMTAAADDGDEGSMKAIDATDAGVMMAYAEHVIIIPGYGMAVAQAQHKVWELAKAAEEAWCEREIRHPPGCRPHARSHERTAGRSRCALRHDLRP